MRGLHCLLEDLVTGGHHQTHRHQAHLDKPFRLNELEGPVDGNSVDRDQCECAKMVPRVKVNTRLNAGTINRTSGSSAPQTVR